jgi:hypothetical protein
MLYISTVQRRTAEEKIMPKEGFQTITIRADVYLELQELAEKNSRSIPREIEHLLKKRKRKET